MKRSLWECYLLGKANKCSLLGKCIGIARDWTSKSGHKSYSMCYVCLFMCMCIDVYLMFDVWCMMQLFFRLMPLLWYVYAMYDFVGISVFMMFWLSDPLRFCYGHGTGRDVLDIREYVMCLFSYIGRNFCIGVTVSLWTLCFSWEAMLEEYDPFNIFKIEVKYVFSCKLF